ncbi:MAG: peptide MFS transporter [Phycisphaerales bacterium]|nr:peptide MFS transporter [Phycisphaerales bacterium]
MSTPTPLSASTSPVAGDNAATFLGHPVGLFLLFLVEMWERFSYYGMRALLVLYLTSPLTGMRKPPAGAPEGFNPGPGWSDKDANTLYGWYTGLAYLLPVLGGIVADKMIGTHRSMVVGGLLIMAGHIALAVSGLGAFHGTEMSMTIFLGGLALIVLGTGHFKPSVSVMVGQLYAPGDPRRDGAFSIFYMGINMGAFLCAFVCGTLGETVGWHWGFGSAAVGMGLGLGLYLICRPMFLKGVGEVEPSRPDLPRQSSAKSTSIAITFLIAGLVLSALFGVAYHVGLVGQVGGLLTPTVAGAIGVVVFGLACWFVAVQRREDRGPVASIFIFMFFNAFFWIAFEQAGSSMTLFTDRYTDTTLFGTELRTTWFQSVNPFLIFIFAPIFAVIWTALGRRGMNPSQPVKIAFGLILLGLGFGLLVVGATTLKIGTADDPSAVVKKAAVFFILGAYFMHTMGELCLSPTGLSYVTKAAPVRFVSLLMGIWFISSFIANLGGGLIAAQVEKIEKGELKLPWNFSQGTGTIQADFFFLFVASSIGAGVVILILTPVLKKLMRRVDD